MSTCDFPSYPSLSDLEFRRVCEAFVERCGKESHDLEQDALRWETWRNISLREKDGVTYITITKTLNLSTHELAESTTAGATNFAGDDFEGIEDERDEAELQVSAPNDQASITPWVEYSIVLSPSYRVPVLYLQLRDLPAEISSLSIDAVYAYLVPLQYRSELRDVGVIGAISVGTHPIHDMTAFFVHPCRTHQAMEELGRDRKVRADNYLVLWIGLLGSSVGLSVPLNRVARGQISAGS